MRTSFVLSLGLHKSCGVSSERSDHVPCIDVVITRKDARFFFVGTGAPKPCSVVGRGAAELVGRLMYIWDVVNDTCHVYLCSPHATILARDQVMRAILQHCACMRKMF